jgi:hypothetical protein
MSSTHIIIRIIIEKENFSIERKIMKNQFLDLVLFFALFNFSLSPTKESLLALCSVQFITPTPYILMPCNYVASLEMRVMGQTLILNFAANIKSFNHEHAKQKMKQFFFSCFLNCTRT